MANLVKVKKGSTIKEINKDYLKDYIMVGWSEYKEPPKGSYSATIGK